MGKKKKTVHQAAKKREDSAAVRGSCKISRKETNTNGKKRRKCGSARKNLLNSKLIIHIQWKKKME